MIYKLSSSLKTFKTLEFKPGLNVLLADKSQDATDKQSRNGSGKTSVVELLHFLLGGNFRHSIFEKEELKTNSFSLKMDLGEQVVIVTRSGDEPNRIYVEGAGENWPTKPNVHNGKDYFSNTNWKLNLGNLWFDIPNFSYKETERFQPTFRSLYPYFARRQFDAGFQHVDKHSENQQLWNLQVAICYLIGMDYSIPGKFQELRVEEKVSAQFSKAAKEGDLGNFFEKSSEILTKLAVSESRASQLKEEIENFQVLPEYTKLEKDADVIAHRIEKMNNENIYDLNLLRHLEESIEVEEPPNSDYVEKIYSDVGMVFTDFSLKRFEDVELFSKRILENRREHLKNEISSIKERISKRKMQIERDEIKRKKIMDLLTTGGALEHFTKLSELAGQYEGETEVLRTKLITAERIEKTKIELDAKRANLMNALENDNIERREIKIEAIKIFETLSKSLYENAGSLKIDYTKNGPKLEVSIDGMKSKGISNMQIFCFDLMLMEISRKNGRALDFLVHDSHLFDGVDERQIAKALQTGARHAEKFGYQYIVSLNTDVLPSEGFDRNFKIKDYLMPVKLTDENDTGGLFGLRFS